MLKCVYLERDFMYYRYNLKLWIKLRGEMMCNVGGIFDEILLL